MSFVISGPDAKTYFQLLKRDKEAIEAEIRSPLEWNERPDKPLSVVMLQRTGMNPLDRNQWSEQHEWLMKTLEAFHRVFRPRVRGLNAEDYEPEGSGDYGSSNPL